MNVESGDNDELEQDEEVKDLTTELENYTDMEQMFDQDSEVLDDNLSQGMKIGKNGRPLT